MSKNTPGPWAVREQWTTRLHVAAEKHDAVCIADMPQWGKDHWNEREANARLISEAPALLVELRANNEVLTKILSIIDADELPSLHAIVRAGVTSSTDAIAKAEGR